MTMARLNVAELAPQAYKAFLLAEQAIRKGPLDTTIRELVKIRASQMNKCLFCIDMHTHEALELGENLNRIIQLPAWRESQLYTEAEQAALAYAEAATEGPEEVTDEIWTAVTDAFKPEEAAFLVAQVAQINMWNRIAGTMHSEPPTRD
ncbi:carboxymuconolactone decarboxylase family protein [Actinoallomurus vinaceus]|uniref:Carboxymuconolactone decarboxylase family protein n=1 Tax=Actinoallomurus vinaceus TaxID=1080074 RepID=A0ABP8U7S8_9ACTN